MVTKHGHPVFVAVPFTELLLSNGVKVALAVKLFDDEVFPLGCAAKLAGMCHEEFMGLLGAMGISVVRYSASALNDEVEDFLQ